MPLDNLGMQKLTPDAILATIDLVNQLDAALGSDMVNLSPEERQKYGSINEQNKLFANKIMDYALVSPNLRSPDVDWVAFEADYNTRKFADTRLLRLENIAKMMSNGKAGLVDIDLNQAQKVIGAYAYSYVLKDYSIFSIGSSPKQNQNKFL